MHDWYLPLIIAAVASGVILAVWLYAARVVCGGEQVVQSKVPGAGSEPEVWKGWVDAMEEDRKTLH